MRLDPARLEEALRQRIALPEGSGPVPDPSPDLAGDDGEPLDLIVVPKAQFCEVHAVLEHVEVGLGLPPSLVPAVDVGGPHAGIGDEADDAEAGLELGDELGAARRMRTDGFPLVTRRA